MMTKKTLIMVAGAAAICIATAAGWVVYQQQIEAQAKAAHPQQVHGEGKKQISCDMSQIIINYQGVDTSFAVDTLINLDAEKYLHDGKGSNRMRRQKVLPTAELIKKYPDAQNVEFFSCDVAEGKTVSVDTIMQYPSNYLITFNNRKRARVAAFKPRKGGKGVKYNTAVKNLYRINIK